MHGSLACSALGVHAQLTRLSGGHVLKSLVAIAVISLFAIVLISLFAIVLISLFAIVLISLVAIVLISLVAAFRSTRVAQGLPSSWKSFCKGKRASGVFPSFAYFPWSVSF